MEEAVMRTWQVGDVMTRDIVVVGLETPSVG
jgi:hypothetical protein